MINNANEIIPTRRRLPPLYLIAAYLAIGVFMTGDGFEQAFLSHYVVSLGFSQSNASLLFAAYGLVAGLSACAAGVLSEAFGPRKIMLAGTAIWLVFHALFLKFGLAQKSFSLMVVYYCIRAIGYPLFVYSLVVWVTRTVPTQNLAAAMGWFWLVFMFGLGTSGSYIPSLTIPSIGEMNTLWLALGFVFVGACIGSMALSLKPISEPHLGFATNNKLKSLTRAVTLGWERKPLLAAGAIMMLAPMSIFGFAVVMPFLFIDTLGFSYSEWLRVWSVFMITNMVMNSVTGMLADRIGWTRLIRWQGCVGVATSCLLFYYIPSLFGHNIAIAMGIALIHGITVTGFVPLSAVFPALAPEEKGAALSLHNLAVGLAAFVGPGIASALLPLFGVQGVVWVYALLYIVSMSLLKFIKVPPMEKKDHNVSHAELASQAAAH
ncbi:MFS transporter [Pseudomonas eucalypticola]|uniref:MFS transporter n=1 Tax=Pseudomonas eucalypticola TaxID=2599595 RepID=A0A7D5H2Z5_9PSED|nr:MFS transporter [Pseudomonas eucalypticola]QKZ04242.1 MFS transporter [Pseudomonas eucalypticola]